MGSEVASKADFSAVRYAQCWEDAELVVEAMNVKEGDVCVSVASAGDNSLSLLTKNPAKVLAFDLSPAQLACLELRIAAFKQLTYGDILMLLGCLPCTKRAALYRICRHHLTEDSQLFWDKNPSGIDMGIAHFGKFERYFKLFRSRVLPLVHSRDDVKSLLKGGDLQQRQKFFKHRWNTWQWRALFRIFFSKKVMGKIGRDPAFFDYVKESTSSFLLRSTEYALTELNPADNPYLHWILLGEYNGVLPHYLKPENYSKIKANINRIEPRLQSLEDFLDEAAPDSMNSYNFSDIFEYMSHDKYECLLQKAIRAGTNNARLVYWNMMVPRRRPEHLSAQLTDLNDLSNELFKQNKTFFYRDFVVEEVCK